MSESLLGQSNVGRLSVEISRERMPQRVRRDVLLNPRFDRVTLDHPLDVQGGSSFPPCLVVKTF